MSATSLTDAELSAVVAEKVAGWTRCRSGLQSRGNNELKGWLNEKYQESHPPAFATDANAVLPLLDKYSWSLTRCKDVGRAAKHLTDPRSNGLYTVSAITELGDFNGRADTFPRAACLSLLRAHGHEG